MLSPDNKPKGEGLPGSNARLEATVPDLSQGLSHSQVSD